MCFKCHFCRFLTITHNGSGLCVRVGWRDEVQRTRDERWCGLQRYKFTRSVRLT